MGISPVSPISGRCPKSTNSQILQGMKTKSLRYPGISKYILGAPRFTFRSHLKPVVSQFVSAQFLEGQAIRVGIGLFCCLPCCLKFWAGPITSSFWESTSSIPQPMIGTYWHHPFTTRWNKGSSCINCQ
jgi:hypothetical protein